MISVLLAAALAASPAPGAGAAAASVPPTVDASVIPYYHLVRPGLATAGQPTEEGLAQLKEAAKVGLTSPTMTEAFRRLARERAAARQ